MVEGSLEKTYREMDEVLRNQIKEPTKSNVRKFASGATRDTDEGKLDYEGFLSPAVLERYARFMHKHRVQPDGNLRDSDNWQKGIPQEQYMKSMFRHFMEVWSNHRTTRALPPSHSPPTQEAFEDALCALLFNVMGYLFEELAMDAAAQEEQYALQIRET